MRDISKLLRHAVSIFVGTETFFFSLFLLIIESTGIFRFEKKNTFELCRNRQDIPPDHMMRHRITNTAV